MALDAVFAADLRKINPETLLDSSAGEQKDRQNQEEIVGYSSWPPALFDETTMP